MVSRVGRLVILAIAAGACSWACSASDPAAVAPDPSAVTGPRPADRTVAIVTTACGSASATIGSAVRLDHTTVLTAAHVVSGAGSVAVVDGKNLPASREWPDFSPAALSDGAAAATIVAFDPDRDLALISTRQGSPDPSGEPRIDRPTLGTAAVGDGIEVHGAAAAPIDAIVAQRTTIEADGVRTRTRVERDGYRLDGATGRGDSGAGVWAADGRLVGLVFAVSTADDTRTWAVSGREIAAFLDAADREPPRSYRCDETTSRLVAEP